MTFIDLMFRDLMVLGMLVSLPFILIDCYYEIMYTPDENSIDK